MTIDKELSSLLASIEKSDYSDVPYEHFYMTDIFSEEFYNEIIEFLPSDSAYLPINHPDANNEEKGWTGTKRKSKKNKDGNERPRSKRGGKSTRGIICLNRAFIEKATGPWERVANILYSPELKDALFKKFNKTILFRGSKGWRDGRHNPLYYTAHNFKAEPTVSLVRDKEAYQIKIHPDSYKKIVTFQLYLPKDNSHENIGTIVNAPVGKGVPKEWLKKRNEKVDGRGPAYHDGKQAKLPEYKRFKFHRNSGYAFPVSDRSFHSVEKLPLLEGFNRDTIMIIYYLQKGAGVWNDIGKRWGDKEVWIP